MIRYLIGCPRNYEKDACIEARYLFTCIDLTLACKKLQMPGLVIGACKDTLQIHEITRQLREILEEDAFGFNFVLKLTPLETMVPSEKDEILKACSQFHERIDPKETFKIIVKKRFTSLRSLELIESIGELVPRTVNLSNPDKIIIIQVIGDETGIALLRPEDIISIAKMKNE